jgi:DNA-binding NarL/FixJ family response regulator
MMRSRPNVVLMDIGMPVLDGVGATRLIADRDPQVRIVVLTGSAYERVTDALEAGASAVVLKDADVEELLAAIRSAPARGHLPPHGHGQPDGPSDGLSPRETEVIGLLTMGRTKRQIAHELGITERTVKTHLSSVFRTVGAADRVQAALWGRDHLAPARS